MTRIGHRRARKGFVLSEANRPGTPGLTTGSHQPKEIEDEIVPFRLRVFVVATV
jgi:hypothetical protein